MAPPKTASPSVQAIQSPGGKSLSTNVYIHNLLLRKGPDFRIYVRWLRGQLTPTQRNVNPSFDNLESFHLDIQTGVVRANVGDINHFLNVSGLANSPLKNLVLSGDGNQIKLRATLHKIVPLPIEMTGTLSPGSGNSIQIAITKIDVLKVPLKALLGGLHITAADFFSKPIPGIKVAGNTIVLNTQQLLPPPHIRGTLTSVRFIYPDLEEVYGSAKEDLERTEKWRNFLRLRGGNLDFGKLTMHQVDLIMVDVSSDAWFDLDLANYAAQLVNGYTRMTPQAGLQIFMPDLGTIVQNQNPQKISMEWLKNRNLPPPADVMKK